MTPQLQFLINRSKTIFLLILILVIVVGSIANEIKIRNLNKKLLKYQNDNIELKKYSDSLQVVKSALISEKDLVKRLKKSEKDLYSKIKEKDDEIISLTIAKASLLLENVELKNIIEKMKQGQVSGTYEQDYRFSGIIENKDINLSGFTRVVYRDSLAHAISSFTRIEKLEINNIELLITHAYNKENKRYDVFIKSKTPYLKLKDGESYYNISEIEVNPPKKFGLLGGLGGFKEFDKDNEQYGLNLNAGVYIYDYELFLTGATNSSLGVIFQKRF